MRGKPLPRGQRLAELAAAQHGVVSIRQLRRRLGYSHAQVQRATEAGRLHRLHHGVYAVGHSHLSLHGQCLAAVLACGPGALLSHWSAAWLLGLLATRPVPIHVTTPLPRRPRPPIRLHHSGALIDEDRSFEQKIPHTSVARTALDLAAAIRHPDRLDRVLQRAEELRVFDLAKADSVLDRNRGHAGAARFRRALAIYSPDPAFTRSGLERCFLASVKAAGLPAPAMNYNVAGLELDAYWEAERFAVELDAYETHGSRAAFERDRLRQEDLLLAGIAVDRVTGPRLKREPQQVIERLGRLLAQRREPLSSPPDAGR